MAKYCDPIELENIWWSWILADRTPQLEIVRQGRTLYTKAGDDLQHLRHIVASADPYQFSSKCGLVNYKDLNMAIKASFSSMGIEAARNAKEGGYTNEIPIEESWKRLSSIVYRICEGIVLNFHPPDNDVRDELIHEALTHTLTKIRRRKLQFTPGVAPPFNLLTTAIIRIMCSIKNKEKRDRDKKSKLVDQVMHDERLPDLNSLNVMKSLVGYGCSIKT